MTDVSARMREDLLRQFSSADGSNPLADFKAAHLRQPAGHSLDAQDLRELSAIMERMGPPY